MKELTFEEIEREFYVDYVAIIVSSLNMEVSRVVRFLQFLFCTKPIRKQCK